MVMLGFRRFGRIKIVLLLLAGLYIGRPGYYWLSIWLSQEEPIGDRECPYGAEGDPNAGSPKARISGTIRTIRLTDAGAFVNRCELTAALVEFTRFRQGTDDVGKKLVVIYVHGWRNDERTTDGDYVSFKKLIDDLTTANKDRKHVVGIYVSWKARNDNLVLGLVNFWSRMFAADRIAQSGTVASIIGAASNIVRTNNHDSELIAIGHSFGARILFSSVQQNFLYALARAHPGYPGGTYHKIEPIADGVILLNPAFEASMYTRLDAQRRSKEKFDPHQPPLLVTISSTADWATRFAFPLGQWAAGWLPEQDLITAGNYQQYWTHDLRRSKKCQAEERFDSWGGFSHKDLCMTPRAGIPFPFHMATTDASIIDGHSDVWNPAFSEYLFELVKKMSERARPPAYAQGTMTVDPPNTGMTTSPLPR